jgi:hypothetical protein
MKKTNALLLACGLALAAAPTLWAQTPDEPARGFVTLSGGVQFGGKTNTESGTFSLYDETGTYTGARRVRNPGFFDIGGGMHLTGKISAGISVSRAAKSTNPAYTVLVPHPLFVGESRTVSMVANHMRHSEVAVNLQAIYQLMASGKYEASVFAGPSIVRVAEDAVNGITATEGSSPYTTVTLATTFRSTSKTVFGGNVGMNINYRITGPFSAGFYVRYLVASAKLASGDSTRKVRVGGPQVGLGLRYSF